MRRLMVLSAALFVVTAGVVAAQQVQAPADLDATMKRVGPASQASAKAIASGAFADSRAQIEIERQGIQETLAFFTAHKTEAGITAANNVLAALDALDKLLQANPVDQMAAQAQAKMVTGACMGCHMQFRVRDEMMNWVLKPGSLTQ
jgi:hypothetical protein